jgi:uncharacterized protein (DUF1501 family)
MSAPFVFTRRTFLRQAAAFSGLSLAASLDKLGLASAHAQAGSYKAIVCVFMFGGNDSNHMVIPYTNYGAYAAVRDASSPIQVPQAALLQISPANLPGQVYGLHPNLTATGSNPSLQSLFASGRLAVVCNAGTLVEPLANRTEYQSSAKKKPSNLFSHSDQAQQAMTSISQASALTSITGWAGRLADRVLSMNPATATPMSMSFSGTQAFGNGASVRTLALPTGGTFGYAGDSTTPNAQQVARSSARAMLIQAWDPNDMVAAAQSQMNVALNASQKLNPIISGSGYTTPTSISTPFTGLTSGISNQLRTVAKLIDQRATLGHSRQVFFVSLGGFDTHTGQGTYAAPGATPTGLAALYQQLGQALAAFYQSTVNLGVAADVATFTLTDFARTFKGNSSGTDHAWGGHHLVLGGSVQGGRFYGNFPSLSLTGTDTIDNNGRWIPSTSFDQFGATVGRWYGVGASDLAQVFPNLSRFPTADLGFLA